MFLGTRLVEVGRLEEVQALVAGDGVREWCRHCCSPRKEHRSGLLERR